MRMELAVREGSTSPGPSPALGLLSGARQWRAWEAAGESYKGILPVLSPSSKGHSAQGQNSYSVASLQRSGLHWALFRPRGHNSVLPTLVPRVSSSLTNPLNPVPTSQIVCS